MAPAGPSPYRRVMVGTSGRRRPGRRDPSARTMFCVGRRRLGRACRPTDRRRRRPRAGARHLGHERLGDGAADEWRHPGGELGWSVTAPGTEARWRSVTAVTDALAQHPAVGTGGVPAEEHRPPQRLDGDLDRARRPFAACPSPMSQRSYYDTNAYRYDIHAGMCRGIERIRSARERRGGPGAAARDATRDVRRCGRRLSSCWRRSATTA